MVEFQNGVPQALWIDHDFDAAAENNHSGVDLCQRRASLKSLNQTPPRPAHLSSLHRIFRRVLALENLEVINSVSKSSNPTSRCVNFYQNKLASLGAGADIPGEFFQTE